MHIPRNLFTTNNQKVLKGNGKGYETLILHLAPANRSGKNICSKASPSCIFYCLNESGHGAIYKKGESTNSVQEARLARTRFYFENPIEFFKMAHKEINSFLRKCERNGTIPCIRVNGTSDLPKLALKLAKDFPEVQFYDYTKILATLKRDNLPPNYDLTFSRSETNWKECLEALKLGYRVSAVVEKEISDYRLREILNLPEEVAILNGDADDLTFLKPSAALLRLSPKGHKIKKDKSGFLIREESRIQKAIKKLLEEGKGKKEGYNLEFTKEEFEEAFQNV
jgi:hypothetical protein